MRAPVHSGVVDIGIYGEAGLLAEPRNIVQEKYRGRGASRCGFVPKNRHFFCGRCNTGAITTISLLYLVHTSVPRCTPKNSVELYYPQVPGVPCCLILCGMSFLLSVFVFSLSRSFRGMCLVWFLCPLPLVLHWLTSFLRCIISASIVLTAALVCL